MPRAAEEAQRRIAEQRRRVDWLVVLRPEERNPDVLGEASPTGGCPECGAAYAELDMLGVPSAVSCGVDVDSPGGIAVRVRRLLVDAPDGVERCTRAVLRCVEGHPSEHVLPESYLLPMLASIGIGAVVVAMTSFLSGKGK